MNAEQSRLEAARIKKAHWKKWGPYLSERQWGTVREDYSESGDAAWYTAIHNGKPCPLYHQGIVLTGAYDIYAG